jgi:site-specific recombinase
VTEVPGFSASIAVDEFASSVAPNAPRHRAVRQLHALLTSLSDSSWQRRIEAFVGLTQWLRSTSRIPAPDEAVAGESSQVTRMRYLLRALELHEPLRSAFAQAAHATLDQCSGINFLACLGLPGDRGFVAETIDRLSRRLLPEPVDEHSLTQLLGRLFPKRRDLTWLAGLPENLVTRWAALLASAQPMSCWSPLLRATADATTLLATRISAVGLSEPIRTRSPECKLQDSPFHQLLRAFDDLLELRQQPSVDAHALRSQAQRCTDLIEACQEVAAAVVTSLEQRGVSVDVVYRIELITNSLERLEQLMKQLATTDAAPSHVHARDLLVHLLAARLTDRSLSAIVRNNLHLLARKIIERAGVTGEHYITNSRSEYFKMLMSAGGGGFLTAGTAALKFLTNWAHFAPFVEGIVSAANYAGSFMLMQFLGFTLATKQPSMTAAALAASLRRRAGHADLTKLVSMISRITRSQLAAAIGNVGVVIPAAIGLDFLHRTYIGRPFLDVETADYVQKSLHPTESGTVFYAALTGVLLWMSSIGAGWLENWAVYRRLPEAIAEHRWGRFLGRKGLRRIAHAFSHNISGIGGNCTLGFLLGMTPVMGKFLGLPLDVRHVTLSTGALTLSVCSLGIEGSGGVVPLLWGAGGIAVIGLLNFGVSFVLALAVALRAREVHRSDQWRLLVSVVITFFRSPSQFFLPPSSDDTEVHGPVTIPPPAPKH